MKFLGMNLTKEVKDLYDENVRKDIQEDTKKWKNLPCSWMERTNVVKMCILPKNNLQIQCRTAFLKPT